MADQKMNIALYAFQKYCDTVLRAAYHYTGSYAEAEDITQEVFLKLHARPQKFSDDEHLKAWLLRAAINRCKNYHKSFYVKKNQTLDELNEGLLSYELSEDDMEILKKIKALPEKYGEVLYLYYYEEYSVKEISGILDKNENTVSSLLRRARQKMKIELEKEEII